MNKRKFLLAASQGKRDEALALKSKMEIDDYSPAVNITYKTPVDFEETESDEYKKYLAYVEAEKAKHPEGTKFIIIGIAKRKPYPKITM